MIELELFNPFSNKKIDSVPMMGNPKFSEEVEDVGGGAFDILNDDDRYSLLTERLVVKAKIDGVVRSAFVINKKEPTLVSPDEYSGLQSTVSGNGLKSWFRDAVVQHPGGFIQQSGQNNRAFNFSTVRGPWYKASDWKAPVVISKWGDQTNNPWRWAPQHWPDAPNANWIWSTANPTPPLGLNFFRYEYTTSSFGKYSFFCAADDIYEVYVDGQLLVTATPGVENWSQTQRVDFDLEAGNHVIGVKVLNSAGKGGFIGAFYKAGDPALQTAAQLISVTNTTSWVVCGYPTVQPGWTPGEVMNTLLDEATARGVRFPSYITRTFTNAKDSYGNNWSRDIDWSFQVGTDDYLKVLQKFQELVCDTWIDPDTFEFHMAKKRGVDRFTPSLTTPTVIFSKGYNLHTATATTDSDIKNSFVVNSNSGYFVSSDPTSVAKYGVIESVLDIGADVDLAKTIANKTLENSSESMHGATYKIIAREGSIPFEDFSVGDWVKAPGIVSDGEKRRVSSISFEENRKNASVSYTIEFDTIFKSRQDDLERWLSNSLAGSMGGAVTTPGPSSHGSPSPGPSSGGELVKVPSNPTTAPTASVAGRGYWNATGQARASVALSWPAVTTYTDGSAAIIPVYEIWAYRYGSSADNAVVVGTTSTTSTTISELQSFEQYSFMITAISNKGISSAYSPAVTVTTVKPGTVILPSSAPLLTSKLGTVTVRWNGLMNNGTAPPPSFSRVQIIYSTTQNGTYTPIGNTISRGGSSDVITTLTGGVTYWFKLVGLDVLDQSTAPSAAASIKVAEIDLSDLGQDILTNLQELGTTLDGKNSVYFSTTTPTNPSGFAKGDLWFVEGTGASAGKVIDVRIYNGTVWNPHQLVANAVLVPSSVGAVLIENGSITTPKLEAKAVTAEKIDFGSANGQALFIGGRPTQGEAQQRIPAPLTDDTYWSLVKSREVDFGGATWPAGWNPTPAGLEISAGFAPSAGVRITNQIPVPESRKLFITYSASAKANRVAVVWTPDGVALNYISVLYSGMTVTIPVEAKYYWIVLTNNLAPVQRNLIPNPSYEDEGLDWTPGGGMTLTREYNIRYRGDSSARFTSTAAGNRYPTAYHNIQGIPVNHGLYVVQYYVRSSVANGIAVQAGARFNKQNRSNYGSVWAPTGVNIGSSSWSLVRNIVAPILRGPCFLQPEMQINFIDASAIAYVDAYMIRPAELGVDAIVTGANTNPNPSAEFDLTGVTTNTSTATLTRSNEWSSVGNWSFKLVPTGTNQHSYMEFGGDYNDYRLGMLAGNTYLLSGTIHIPAKLGTVKAPHEAARSLMAYWRAASRNFSEYVFAEPPPNEPGTYDVSLLFTAPSADGITVRAYNGHTQGTVYWDNVQLREVTITGTNAGYFDGDTVGASWEGPPHASESVKTSTSTNAATVIDAVTVFEVIGEDKAQRVEILPTGVTAYGVAGKTVMTDRGIEVFNSSSQTLLRLGHDVSTGLAVLGPEGELVPLAEHVFGMHAGRRTNNILVPTATAANRWGASIPEAAWFTFTSQTGRIMLFVSADRTAGYSPNPGTSEVTLVKANVRRVNSTTNIAGAIFTPGSVGGVTVPPSWSMGDFINTSSLKLIEGLPIGEPLQVMTEFISFTYSLPSSRASIGNRQVVVIPV